MPIFFKNDRKATTKDVLVLTGSFITARVVVEVGSILYTNMADRRKAKKNAENLKK